MKVAGLDWNCAVDFYVTHEEGDYLIGITSDSASVLVSVYCHDKVKRDKMLEWEGEWQAPKIVGHTRKKGDFYLNIASSQMEKADETFEFEDDDVFEPVVADASGTMLNEAEFDLRYRGGCCWCSDPVFFDRPNWEIIDTRTIIHRECRTAAYPYCK